MKLPLIGVVLAMTLSSTTIAADAGLQAERFGVYLRVDPAREFFEQVDAPAICNLVVWSR